MEIETQRSVCVCKWSSAAGRQCQQQLTELRYAAAAAVYVNQFTARLFSKLSAGEKRRAYVERDRDPIRKLFLSLHSRLDGRDE